MIHRYQRILLSLLALFLVGFSWLGGFAPTTEAAVGFDLFSGCPAASAPEIKVKWETQTETDIVGFRVKRSATSNVQNAITLTAGQMEDLANTDRVVRGARIHGLNRAKRTITGCTSLRPRVMRIH